MKNIDLRKMLSKEYLLENGVDGLENKFDEIAEILLTKTKIVKGSQEYYITDIEFYLYCQGHEDGITHIRNCNAGKWFFHRSGVDIAFQSENVIFDEKTQKWKREENAFYGGILISGIKPLSKSLTNKDLNGRPINVRDELFYDLDVMDISQNFPILQFDDNHNNVEMPNPTKRKNIKRGYVEAEYRYCTKESE